MASGLESSRTHGTIVCRDIGIRASFGCSGSADGRKVYKVAREPLQILGDSGVDLGVVGCVKRTTNISTNVRALARAARHYVVAPSCWLPVVVAKPAGGRAIQ